MSRRFVIGGVLVFAIALFIFAGILGSAAWRTLHPPAQKLIWDFTTDNDISRVNWPISNHTNYWQLNGQYDLTFEHRTLKDRGQYFEQKFHETVQTISLERKGNNVSFWVIHFDEGKTIEYGYKHAKEVLAKWCGEIDIRPAKGERYETPDDWFEGIKRGENVPEQYHMGGQYGGHLMITVFGDPKAGLQRRCTLTLAAN